MSTVVITGVGAITPAGTDAELGTAMARPVVAGAIADPLGADLDNAVRARIARAERITQVLTRAAARALCSAGVHGPDEPPRRDIGLVVGTAFGCWLSNAAHQQRLRESGAASASPRTFAATVSNAAAGEIGIAYRLGGPAVTLTAGAASGLAALSHGATLVESGQYPTLLVGGGDALGPFVTDWLAGARLETHPLAEAAAFVVLEGAATAQRRGAVPLAAVLGGAVGFEPSLAWGRGLRAVVQAAVRAADVPVAAFRAVVRGAPPPVRLEEARVIAEVVDDSQAQVLPVKNHLGETFGAAGPLGLLVALHALAPGELGLLLDVCGTGHVAALVVRRESGPLAAPAPTPL